MSFVAKRSHEAGHKYASRGIPCGNTSGYWLWRHTTGNSLQFGMGKSTAQNVFSKFENALAARTDDFIRFPTTHIEIQTTIKNFEMKYGWYSSNSWSC